MITARGSTWRQAEVGDPSRPPIHVVQFNTALQLDNQPAIVCTTVVFHTQLGKLESRIIGRR